MIKKDIAYETQPSGRDPESIDREVDDIFAAADLEMNNQNKASVIQFKEKKKSKHPILRFFLPYIVVVVVVIVALIYVAISSFNSMYVGIQQGLLSQVADIREQLLELDDDSLTIDQYYQKQIMLLLSEEDLKNAFDDIGSVEVLSQLLKSDGTIDINFIPEDKIEKYNQLIEEYQQALEDAAEATEGNINPEATEYVSPEESPSPYENATTD